MLAGPRTPASTVARRSAHARPCRVWFWATCVAAASHGLVRNGHCFQSLARLRAGARRASVTRSREDASMAKDKLYETEDGSRIAPLGELSDFEVAEGFPDIRGWRV